MNFRLRDLADQPEPALRSPGPDPLGLCAVDCDVQGDGLRADGDQEIRQDLEGRAFVKEWDGRPVHFLASGSSGLELEVLQAIAFRVDGLAHVRGCFRGFGAQLDDTGKPLE